MVAFLATLLVVRLVALTLALLVPCLGFRFDGFFGCFGKIEVINITRPNAPLHPPRYFMAFGREIGARTAIERARAFAFGRAGLH